MQSISRQYQITISEFQENVNLDRKRHYYFVYINDFFIWTSLPLRLYSKFPSVVFVKHKALEKRKTMTMNVRGESDENILFIVVIKNK